MANACSLACCFCGRCETADERPGPFLCDNCGRELVGEEDEIADVEVGDRLCGRCADERDEARRDDDADRKRDEEWADRWDRR